MKNFLLVIIFIFVLVVSALFFAQNDSMVEVHYFAGTFKWQMNWILVTMLVIGILIGSLALMANLISTKVKLANANRKLTNCEKEINNLRALPIKDNY